MLHLVQNNVSCSSTLDGGTAVHTRPVLEKTINMRIRRKLQQKGLTLKRSIAKRDQEALGELYLVDLNEGRIVRTHLKLDDFAKEMGYMKPWEQLAQASC